MARLLTANLAREGALALLLAAAMWRSAAAGESALDATAGTRWLGNVGHAEDAASRAADQLLEAAVHPRWRAFPSDFDSVELAGSAALARYAQHPGLDRLSAGVQLAHRHSTGFGALHPWLRAALSADHDWYHDRYREGWRLRAELAAGMRFDARCDGVLVLHAERRTQQRDLPDGPELPGTVYDQGRQGFDLDGRVALDAGWTLAAALHWQRGDFDGVHQFDLDSYAGITAYAGDPSFGPEAYGYRFRAIARGGELMLNRALDGNSSLSLVVGRTVTSSAAGFQYADPSAGLIYAWRH